MTDDNELHEIHDEYWKEVQDKDILTTQPFDPKYLTTQYWSEERGFYSEPISESKPEMKKESFCELLKRVLNNVR